MSNETKQTALDIFIERLRYLGYLGIDYSPQLIQAIEQAKEMEKEQIEDAFSIGEVMATDYFYGEDNCAINYYNETYGGNK
jgi:hypothetical protein